jgi:hypothetical protein
VWCGPPPSPSTAFRFAQGNHPSLVHAVANLVAIHATSDLEPNMRATDFLVPGVGLFPGDYVAGPLLLVGFDPASGEHEDVPEGVEKRLRLIEREAGR